MKKIIILMLLFTSSELAFAAKLPSSITEQSAANRDVISPHTPLIIAHRGGTADGPENTIPTIQASLKNGADIIWITVQLSKDEVPILYRPSDLSTLTDMRHSRLVSAKTVESLQALDAGAHYFQYKPRPLGVRYVIPTLEEVLITFPNTTFFIDLKSPDAPPLNFVKHIAQVIAQTNANDRVRLYSTSAAYTEAIRQNAELQAFQSRAETRDILFGSKLSNRCDLKSYQPGWHAFELTRILDLVEHFTLGEGHTPATFKWSKNDMDCFKTAANTVVIIGVNSKEDYRYAKNLGAYAVMVDSPKAALCYRENSVKNKDNQASLCAETKE